MVCRPPTFSNRKIRMAPTNNKKYGITICQQQYSKHNINNTASKKKRNMIIKEKYPKKTETKLSRLMLKNQLLMLLLQSTCTIHRKKSKPILTKNNILPPIICLKSQQETIYRETPIKLNLSTENHNNIKDNTENTQ